MENIPHCRNSSKIRWKNRRNRGKLYTCSWSLTLLAWYIHLYYKTCEDKLFIWTQPSLTEM